MEGFRRLPRDRYGGPVEFFRKQIRETPERPWEKPNVRTSPESDEVLSGFGVWVRNKLQAIFIYVNETREPTPEELLEWMVTHFPG